MTAKEKINCLKDPSKLLDASILIFNNGMEIKTVLEAINVSYHEKDPIDSSLAAAAIVRSVNANPDLLLDVLYYLNELDVPVSVAKPILMSLIGIGVVDPKNLKITNKYSPVFQEIAVRWPELVDLNFRIAVCNNSMSLSRELAGYVLDDYFEVNGEEKRVLLKLLIKHMLSKIESLTEDQVIDILYHMFIFFCGDDTRMERLVDIIKARPSVFQGFLSKISELDIYYFRYQSCLAKFLGVALGKIDMMDFCWKDKDILFADLIALLPEEMYWRVFKNMNDGSAYSAILLNNHAITQRPKILVNLLKKYIKSVTKERKLPNPMILLDSQVIRQLSTDQTVTLVLRSIKENSCIRFTYTRQAILEIRSRLATLLISGEQQSQKCQSIRTFLNIAGSNNCKGEDPECLSLLKA